MEDNELIAYKIVTESQKKKKKTCKNLIERDTELLQGAYFGGKPEHILKKNKKKENKEEKINNLN